MQVPAKIVSTRGKKQVGAVTSAERGELVTIVCAVNAIGNAIPPFYLFPRKRWNRAFLGGAVAGSSGTASGSGWMNSEVFSELYLPFFIAQTRCSKDHPVLMIMDNHQSHCSLAAISKAKDNGIVILTLPPHTSHQMQPLDKTVYGPMKEYYNRAADDWMRTNPGRAVTIWQMAELTGNAFTLATTPRNILSGFEWTGIFPLNTRIFTDADFLPSDLTDRPDPANITPTELIHEEAETVAPANVPVLHSTPTTSAQSASASITLTPQSANQPKIVTPSDILPIPKAQPRANKRKGRKRKRATVWTNTPEKQLLEQDLAERQQKLKSIMQKKARKSKPVEVIPSSSEEDEELPVCLTDSESAGENDEARPLTPPSPSILVPGEHVLVQCKTERNKLKNFVGMIKSVLADGRLNIKYLRRKRDSAAQFVYPEREDMDTVHMSTILLVLGRPVTVGGTKRAVKSVIFGIDLTQYNVQ